MRTYTTAERAQRAERYATPEARAEHGRRLREAHALKMEKEKEMQSELRRRSRLSYVPPSALGELEETVADLSDAELLTVLEGTLFTQWAKDALFFLLGSGEVIK